MKKYISLFIIAFLLQIGTAEAQGISGKRLTVFYNADYHGSLLAAVQHNEFDSDAFGYYNYADDEDPSFLKSIINFRHSLNVSYALSRRVSVGGQFGFSRDAYGGEPSNITANYKAYSYEAEVKLFNVRRKGGIAPLGTYFAMRAGLNKVLTNTKVSEQVRNNPEEMRTVGSDANLFSLAFVWGKQVIVYKKVMMNFGFETKLNFVGGTEEGSEGDFLLDFSNENPRTRVFWNDFIRLTIGVGIAAY